MTAGRESRIARAPAEGTTKGTPGEAIRWCPRLSRRMDRRAHAAAQWQRPPYRPDRPPYGQPTPIAPTPPGGSMPEVGGTPNAPVTARGPDPAVVETQRLLDEAKQSDAGRRLEWAYLEAEGGVNRLDSNLQARRRVRGWPRADVSERRPHRAGPWCTARILHRGRARADWVLQRRAAVQRRRGGRFSSPHRERRASCRGGRRVHRV